MSEQIAYVGCRTNKARNAQGLGIGVYRVPAQGAWEPIQLYETEDPSFLASDSRRRWLYAVEGDGSTVSAFERTADARISLIGRADTHGINPVDVLISPNDRFAIVCNHVTRDGTVSNIAVFPITADGSLGSPSDVRPLTGEIGINRKEQTASKPHHAQFSPDGQTIAIADKGLDEVQFFDFDPGGKLMWREADTVRLPWGAGPRNLAYHPTLPYLYLLNELDSTVVSIALNASSKRPEAIQRLSSQSGRFSLQHRAAWIEISKDGRLVYVGNRGQDTIGVFSIDFATGALSAVGWSDTGGRVPRHFALSPAGDRMFVANEFSHDVMQFTVGTDGMPSKPVKVLETGSPTCILFA